MRRKAEGYYEILAGTETIKVTAEHPFWRQGSGWAEAKDLKPGDPIAAATGDVVVRSSKYIKGPVSVYNFSVEVNHNYFVSPHKIWVHNANENGKNDTCNLNPTGSKSRGDMLASIRERVGSDFKNHPLRQQYETEVAELSVYSSRIRPDMSESELRELAQEANLARRDLGVKYKDVTPEPLRDFIYHVNESRYGDRLGPTLDYLREQNKSYEQIIESASRANPDVDKLLQGFSDWLDEQPTEYLEKHQ